MNLVELLLIFIEGFLLAFYIAVSMRLKRDYQRASGIKARAIFRMASVQMAQKTILAVYLFATTAYMQLRPAQNEYAVRFFAPAVHGLIVLLGSPFLCLTAYYIVRAQEAKLRTALTFQLIILLAIILYMLTGWEWVSDGMHGLLTLFFVYIDIYIIAHLRKYEMRLNQIYSNTAHRGVYWVFGFLIINILQGVLWVILCMYLDATWARIVFYLESFVMDEVYAYMLEAQNYDVEEMTAPTEEGIVSVEAVTEKTEEKNALELALQQLDLEIPRYCKEEGHFADSDITVIDLTEAVNSNRTYVAKWFSMRGVNFNTYINDLRVEYAEQLLRTTQMSPSDICTMAGFCTTHTFARVFKAKYGCTPAQYKGQIKESEK